MSQLPPLVEALIRKHRLRSRANAQDGLREIGACLKHMDDASCTVVEFYAHYHRDTPQSQVDYGRDLLAIEFEGEFYDTRSRGRENIARNFANYNVGGDGELHIEIKEGWGQAYLPLLEEHDPMLKTAKAFLSEQQADALSQSTVPAPDVHHKRARRI